MASSFWRGKKVLITGHTGFKGSWLSLWLQHLGAQVVGYSLQPPTQPNLFVLAAVAEEMVCITGDIRDAEHLQAVMATHQPDVVFHLAAQALVRASYVSPIETYETNVLGTAQVLEAVRRSSSVRVVVNITTDKCYENQEWVWGYREKDPLGGHDPYASSKACAELVTAAYRSSFLKQQGILLASARAGNVIGGGDWAKDRLIPDILQAFSEKRPVLIRSPQAVRPWQHVLEPLSGYLKLAKALWQEGEAFAEGWNFGPPDQDAKPVQWIVEHLRQLWGEGATWELDGGMHPHEAHLLKLDCTKAREQLGWTPQLSLELALAWTVEWYKAYLNEENLKALTVAQILRYEALQETQAPSIQEGSRV